MFREVEDVEATYPSLYAAARKPWRKRRDDESAGGSGGEPEGETGGGEQVDLLTVSGGEQVDPQGAGRRAGRPVKVWGPSWGTLRRATMPPTSPPAPPALTATSPRVVSLLPSATEIVCALGAGDALVGISHECDFPESIRDRPVLTRSRVDPQGSSRDIDAAVRAVVRGALSIYAVDEERLGALAPDVIITQDLCEVCAVSLDDVRAAVARLAHREHIRIVSLRPTRLGDVLDDVGRVAAAIGRPARGAALRQELADRVRTLTARAARASSRPRVVSLEWLDPLMLGGTWMPELIELAGGTPVGAETGRPAPTIEPGALKALRPDVVVVKPCGFSLERTLAERDVIERSVVEIVGDTARIYVTDGNAFFNRPGPRLVESLEIMAACVHPERFDDFARTHADALCRLARA